MESFCDFVLYLFDQIYGTDVSLRLQETKSVFENNNLVIFILTYLRKKFCFLINEENIIEVHLLERLKFTCCV